MDDLDGKIKSTLDSLIRFNLEKIEVKAKKDTNDIFITPCTCFGCNLGVCGLPPGNAKDSSTDGSRERAAGGGA